MKKVTRILALALSVVMCLSLVVGCGKKDGGNSGAKDTLVVGYSPFSSKFSPFFSETAYDQDVYTMTALGLLTSDRTGAIVEKGIKGETRSYNGTDYTYYGPADMTVSENPDGTVYYDFTLRDDLKFSDGEPITIDDVIFSMYVLCDPTYDGASTLYAQPIQGMAEYRSGMSTMSKYLGELGEGSTDFSVVDEATQKAFWDAVNDGGVKFAQEIVDYMVANSGVAEGDVKAAAAGWGFEGLADDATAKDLFLAIAAKYDWNFSASLSLHGRDCRFRSVRSAACGCVRHLHQGCHLRRVRCQHHRYPEDRRLQYACCVHRGLRYRRVSAGRCDRSYALLW